MNETHMASRPHGCVLVRYGYERTLPG